MPAIFEYRLEVPADAIDRQGHVNNLEYLRWMQDAAVAHSAAQGWPMSRYQECGSGWVVRTHTIEYLAPAFAGEHLAVFTWISNFRKVRSLRKYRIVRPADERLLARAETDWTYVSLEHRVPRRVPGALLECFEVVSEEDEPFGLRRQG